MIVLCLLHFVCSVGFCWTGFECSSRVCTNPNRLVNGEESSIITLTSADIPYDTVQFRNVTISTKGTHPDNSQLSIGLVIGGGIILIAGSGTSGSPTTNWSLVVSSSCTDSITTLYAPNTLSCRVATVNLNGLTPVKGDYFMTVTDNVNDSLTGNWTEW